MILYIPAIVVKPARTNFQPAVARKISI